jgi:hypothetical protein
MPGSVASETHCILIVKPEEKHLLGAFRFKLADTDFWPEVQQTKMEIPQRFPEMCV